MRFEPLPGEMPQAWDVNKVAEAFTDAQRLAITVSSETIGPYLEELQKVIERTLEPAVSDVDFRDRLAYMLYGFALFSATAMAAAEAYGSVDQTEVLSMLGKALDAWLDANS